MGVSPGWYPDPAQPTITRYWDGEQWRDFDSDPASADARVRLLAPHVEAPHRAPLSVDASTPQSPQLLKPPISKPAPASILARIAARLIDLALGVVLTLLVSSWFILEYFREVYPTFTDAVHRYESTGSYGNIQISSRAQHLALAVGVIAAALWLAYEVPSLIDRGQTLGKRIVGIKVITPDTGKPPRLRGALIRWACMGLFLPISVPVWAVALLLDSLPALRDRRRRQCLHDRLGNTVVVWANESPPTKTSES